MLEVPPVPLEPLAPAKLPVVPPELPVPPELLLPAPTEVPVPALVLPDAVELPVLLRPASLSVCVD